MRRLVEGMIYFGCIGGPGHHLHDGSGFGEGHLLKTLRPLGIYPRIDGGFCIGAQENPDGTARTPERMRYQEEGVARLTHFNGWTILAFWDRSVDTRFGSNSAFIEEGYWDFRTMVSRAQEAFPDVWSRFDFEIALYDPKR